MASIALAPSSNRPLMPVLAALSVAHLLNDLIQSMIPAIYPVIKDTYHLDFARIGLITLAFQVTSSILQPVLGYLTDRRPWPYAMVAGMGATLLGLLGLSFAISYEMVLVAAALVGLGSAVFHPEATRMARHAAAGRQGLAQGVFQIGGHAGYAIGPLLAAAVVVPRGQTSLSWFSGVALLAMVLMSWTAGRYAALRREQAATVGATRSSERKLPASHVVFAMTILIVLLFSKNAYTAVFTS
jgi:FSR family fosmidomycin resistance protein-like MFS transporter